MTSVLSGIKQVPAEGGNFVTISSVTLQNYTVDTDGVGANVTGSFEAGATIAGAGKFLRDMGKTVVSSGITFRKVQLISSMGAGDLQTNGVVGSSPAYLTGYIVLAKGGLSTAVSPALVARV